MNDYSIRTDLALEATESVRKNKCNNMNGVEVYEDELIEGVYRTTVVISSKNAAKQLGKTVGTYITLEAQALQEQDEDYHRKISEQIADTIKSIIPDEKQEKGVLVVGLGNRAVTADSLGPLTVDNLMITRHIIDEYGKQAYDRTKMNRISSIVPGVMAQTGMESAEIIKGVINQTRPDIMIVVDALAARSTKRLNRTIQITDAGILPGSGVGNHRNAINQDSMGIPVIAIGIPMVVDAATIVNDAYEMLITECGIDIVEELRNSKETQLHNMYMTAKDIDQVTKRLSYTLSEAINMALEME